ncbi:hypothetical protein RSOLAG22IIIB_07566 [Rhizoctonia solani]|uniref:Uncharacterized protein n=1 Tax=Rhizoctonia solani TaxID=456999 RepID=A0A0K6FPH9_9AGAM|nr:hypothetical protein RSOLAG22IIIB_07566 [Rhizoctonia solani]
MSLAEVYNSLPTVGAANAAFTDREAVFAKLAPLFAAYQFQFGVCLVHAHCKLQEGEAMVADGNVTRPVFDGPRYPERWLADGTPYEFTREPTETPPPELIRDFQAIVGKDALLGLFHASRDQNGKTAPDGKVWIEHTEGRDNIVELIDRNEMAKHMETAWIPGTDSPVTMACHSVCAGTQEDHVNRHDNY